MHPLDGPRLKIRRAESELNVFRQAEDAFLLKNKYEIIRAEFNPKTQKYVYRMSIKVEPPLEWGVLVGEIAHNLRSALDGLVYQLARLNGVKTPARSTQFPIFLVGRTKKERRGKRKGLIPHFEGMRFGDGRSMIRDLRPEHQAIIERLQPYKRIGRSHDKPWGFRWARSHPLWLLHEINNADKHRLIQVAGIKEGAVGASSSDPLDRPIFTRGPHRVLKNGAKFCEAGPNVQMDSYLIPLIAFCEGCDAVKGATVHLALRLMLDQVSEIVESFGPEFA